MDEATRQEVAECLEQLADQTVWNPELWQRRYDLVKANWDDELLNYVHDDVIHYSGEFHSRNIFGFGVRPDRHQLENYRQEFRDIATALRASMSLSDAKKKYGLCPGATESGRLTPDHSRHLTSSRLALQIPRSAFTGKFFSRTRIAPLEL